MIILYASTMFLSAALLFVIQPMIGKMVLPLLGGVPAVWNTCMVFFQSVLLLGYAYAHFSTRWFTSRRQVLLHLAMVLCAMALLPIGIGTASSSLSGSDNPVPWLLGFLSVSAGLPLFVISATAPLLQKWFAEGDHRLAGDPYFLYAASNAGSMLGLLSYPVLIEPHLHLIQQSRFWAGGYYLLAGGMVCCSPLLWRRKQKEGKMAGEPIENSDRSPIPEESAWTLRSRLSGEGSQCADDPPPRPWRWVLLALMLGVTTYLTTDVAPFPLLWVVPLAIYLLTFILVFARRPLLPPLWLGRVLGLCSVVLLVAYIAGSTQPAWLMTPLNLLMFASAALICHGELAKSRPEAGRLTEYYLYMSAGGVLGGLFNALVAPLLFRSLLEYPLVMGLACAVRPTGKETFAQEPRPIVGLRDVTWTAIIGLSTAASILVVQASGLNLGRLNPLCTFGLPALLTYRHVKKPVRFSLGLAAILAASLLFTGILGRPLLTERNFFGTLRVTVDTTGKYHQLVHGDTLHGRQSLDPLRQNEPLSYYCRTGPIGQVVDIFDSSSAPPVVAVVGLGTGSMAAYAEPYQDWTFYEIDPAVERIARSGRYFTFLKNSRARTLKILVGDGRLKLKNAGDHSYGLIVLDAFSSDSIPIHLITREALQLYIRKLADNGMLAFHITNRRLDLEPVLANLASDAGLIGLIRKDFSVSNAERAKGKERSVWVVMARHKDVIATLNSDPRWHILHPSVRTGVWTDDFSNILSVLSWKI
jgi:hypothetical protein